VNSAIDDVDVGEQERGFREQIGGWARAFGLGARAGAGSSTRDDGAARADLLRWSADLFWRSPPAPKGAAMMGLAAAPALIVQFQVIRGPDEMIGSKNQGGARLFFFALDSLGQLWRGVEEEGAQPTWSPISGPLNPPSGNGKHSL
jgi:hypothetical protein